jgi:hypothetical protein
MTSLAAASRRTATSSDHREFGQQYESHFAAVICSALSESSIDLSYAIILRWPMIGRSQEGMARAGTSQSTGYG